MFSLEEVGVRGRREPFCAEFILLPLLVTCTEMRHCLRYILDLNKEQEASFVERVAAMAQKAQFEPWTEGMADGVHAVFAPQKN